MEGTADPEEAMQAAGVFFSDSAITWLTPGQKAVLVSELEDMEVCVKIFSLGLVFCVCECGTHVCSCCSVLCRAMILHHSLAKNG